jgi:hypothetical protein
MSETTTPDATTTPPPKPSVNAIRADLKVKREAKAKQLTDPKPPPRPAKVKAQIVRVIPPGSKIADDAIITVNVPNPKVKGNKNWQRWEAGYPKPGASKAVKDVLATSGGPTIGDLRYDFERGFIDIVPAPAAATKK